ncbi:hypothetical protein C162_07459 [Paenibacillus sp. FSL R7-269]|uniref:hypothetical protein n=1 Tax=Paenibacillus sp. FSL R7-269 TaxID=1226755 RepID=UPI0003E1BED1|nr:hypothetical protein [Paenibacillus sp. FSL R7-269]ETT53073.1 hypothetical protein C162_07459 [Paenibacillus sp. FSL R7-269]
MNNIAKVIAGSLLIGIFVGCADNSNATPKQDATNQEAQPSAPQSSSDQSNFNTGIFIELSDVNDTKFNDDIKNSLNAVMNALVNNNAEKFKSAFANDKSADAHGFMLGKEYSFDKLNSVEEDSAGRTVVTLEVKVKDGSGIKFNNLSFYYVKDDTGNWGLRTID